MKNEKELDEEETEVKEEDEELEEKIEEQVEETEEVEEQEEKLLDEEDEIGVEELTDRLLRLQADFMNYKNRAEKDKKITVAYATEDLISQILPILDNFERALDNGDEEEGFYKGVRLIYDQFIEILEKNGLEEIKCLGESFDPKFHHGVLVEECKDEKEGTILDVLQKGYTLKGKVIRPTMVKVCKK